MERIHAFCIEGSQVDASTVKDPGCSDVACKQDMYVVCCLSSIVCCLLSVTLTFISRPVHKPRAAKVLRVDVGATIEQREEHEVLMVLHRQQKGRGSQGIPCVDVGPMI
jgi:hypothetical protein